MFLFYNCNQKSCNTQLQLFGNALQQQQLLMFYDNGAAVWSGVAKVSPANECVVAPEKTTEDACEPERPHNQCLSFHPCLFSPHSSQKGLPSTFGPSLSNSKIKSIHPNNAKCTHHHFSGAMPLRKAFSRCGSVFQVVISSHCCLSTNQKSHKATGVIISASEEKKDQRS